MTDLGVAAWALDDPVQAAHDCSAPEVTPTLLAAQVQQESAWHPDAVSSAGAAGLAQFPSPTWARYGTDGDGDAHASPFDPADALASQGKFMCHPAEQIDCTDLPGDPTALVLAAYNAGPGAVSRYGGVPAVPSDAALRHRDRVAALVAPSRAPSRHRR